MKGRGKELLEDEVSVPSQVDTSDSKSAMDLTSSLSEQDVTKAVAPYNARYTLPPTTIRENKAVTRVGKVFLPSSDLFMVGKFCYAEKTIGVEPGFMAVTMDESFFSYLEFIIVPNSDMQLTEEQVIVFTALFEALKKKPTIEGKTIVFYNVVTSQNHKMSSNDKVPPIISWLCDEMCRVVQTGQHAFDLWMYKLDYAAGQGKLLTGGFTDTSKRIDSNKEALRENVGTKLAGIFSLQNQKQECVWIRAAEPDQEMRVLLACRWQNGLQTFDAYLYRGEGPDFDGLIVDDIQAKHKHSRYIPGLAEHLIFALAIGDRDTIAKGNNKGMVNGAYFGIDYGKPFEGPDITASLKEDFSFVDRYAQTPEFLRSASVVGIARHRMYRNFSVFYDNPRSALMKGVHLLRKVYEGVDPSEAVMDSYPGLKDELARIQADMPNKKSLQLILGIQDLGKAADSSPYSGLISQYATQLEKLEPIGLFFLEMKLDLIANALRFNMPFSEGKGYLDFMDNLSVDAYKRYYKVRQVFSKSVLLTKQQIDFVEQIEKLFSPCSMYAKDKSVQLLNMCFDPPEKKVVFSLSLGIDDTYVLSTALNPEIAQQLQRKNLAVVEIKGELQCQLTAKALSLLMTTIQREYSSKEKALLTVPIVPTTKKVFPSKAEIERSMSHRVSKHYGQVPQVLPPREKLGPLQLPKAAIKRLEGENSRIQLLTELKKVIMYPGLKEFEKIEHILQKTPGERVKKLLDNVYDSATWDYQSLFLELLVERYTQLTGKSVLEEIQNSLADRVHSDVLELLSMDDQQLLEVKTREALLSDSPLPKFEVLVSRPSEVVKPDESETVRDLPSPLGPKS